MAWQLARRFRISRRAGDRDFSENAELLLRDRPATQYFDSAISKSDDCGFQTMESGSTVHDERNHAVEFVEDVSGSGWTDPAESVGARSGQWPPESRDDVAENRMRAEPESDGFKACGNDIRYHRLARKNKS
jgi:hypothetical protein